MYVKAGIRSDASPFKMSGNQFSQGSRFSFDREAHIYAEKIFSTEKRNVFFIGSVYKHIPEHQSSTLKKKKKVVLPEIIVIVVR